MDIISPQFFQKELICNLPRLSKSHEFDICRSKCSHLRFLVFSSPRSAKPDLSEVALSTSLTLNLWRRGFPDFHRRLPIPWCCDCDEAAPRPCRQRFQTNLLRLTVPWHGQPSEVLSTEPEHAFLLKYIVEKTSIYQNVLQVSLAVHCWKLHDLQTIKWLMRGRTTDDSRMRPPHKNTNNSLDFAEERDRVSWWSSFWLVSKRIDLRFYEAKWDDEYCNMIQHDAACYDVNTLGQTCPGSVHRLEVDWSGRSALTCGEALNGMDVLCLGTLLFHMEELMRFNFLT